ncbi:coiled-coil domain-containing protein [Anaerophaga thermohalophila]|uniref:coiled-coil domain-containing protein n=1 Tax=Anaerophaga thermohalophila TaxID=177400 RepID=UPI0005C795C8|nr:hypothetical protein [Anaerophaga thermohalophila]
MYLRKNFNLLDTKKFLDRNLKINSAPSSPSRRTAIKRLSLILIGLSPMAKVLGKAFSSPFEIRRKGKAIQFIYNRQVAWEIDPAVFGKNAVLRYRESEQGFFLVLRHATYSYSGFRPDFKAAISHETGTWKMQVKFTHLGINKTVPFLPWLKGKEQLSGYNHHARQMHFGSGDTLSIPAGQVLLDNKWQLDVIPDKPVTLNVFNSEEKYKQIAFSPYAPADSYWVEMKKHKPSAWITLNEPLDKFEALSGLNTDEKGKLQIANYPFSSTGIALGDDAGTAILWACNESSTESHTRYQTEVSDQSGLALYRSRFVKEYQPESEPFGLVADLGDNAQWYGAPNAAFALAGSSTAFFSLFGEGKKVKELNCKALLTETLIPVNGARSLPAAYLSPVEVEVHPQDPVIRTRPQKVEPGEIQNIGILNRPRQQERVNWLYVNRQSMRVKFKLQEAIKFNLIRPEDFLNLQFEFVNFKLENNILEIDDTKSPAFLIVHFPSQHLRERAFNEFGTKNVPVDFIRAGSSRLVFKVPPGHPAIPLILENLLDWNQFDLQVNYRARWFNTSSTISQIKTTLQNISIPLGARGISKRMKTRPVIAPLASRRVKTIEKVTTPARTSAKPMSAMEVKVAMSSTPRGAATMTLSDNQLKNVLATPEIELSVAESLTGAMRNLLEMKPPSVYETSIEAPTYAEISPNQFAGFNHSFLLRDEFDEYSEDSVQSVNLEGEGTTVPAKTTRDLRMDPSRQVKRLNVTPLPLNQKSTKPKTQVELQQPGDGIQTGRTLKRSYKNVVSPLLINAPGLLIQKSGQLFELWHTRMGIKLASGEVDESALNALKTVRVLWSKWANETVEAGPVSGDDNLNNIPEPRDFHELVHLTSNYTGLKENLGTRKITPRPVKANQLMLSGLGAWFNYAFRMDTAVESTGLVAWDQRATMGRDHFIKVVRRGYLFPFGHKAVKITVVNREMRVINNVSSAVLIKRVYIKVTQPELFFGQAENASFVPFPFQRVEIKDLQKKIHDVEVKTGVFELYQPQDTSEPDPFKIEADDASGNPVRMEVPLAFVDGALTDHHPVVDHYNNQGWDYFSSSPASRSIAYARSLVPGDTSFETKSIMFAAGKGDFVNMVNFYPEVKEASVFVRQIEELTGERNAVRISLVDDNNLSMVFAKVIENEKPSLVFGDSEKSGGLLTPNMAVSGFSKLTGITGNKIEDLEKLVVQVNEIFSLAEEYMPKIFGIINFVDLLLPDVDLSSAVDTIKNSIEDIREQIEELQNKILMVLARIDSELKKLNVLLEILGDLLDNNDIVSVLQDSEKLADALAAYGISVPGDLKDTLEKAIAIGKEIQSNDVEIEDITGFISNPQGLKNKLSEAGIEVNSEISQAVDKMLQLVDAFKNNGLDGTEITAVINGLGMASQLFDVQSLIKTLASQVAEMVVDAIPEIPNVKFQVKGDEVVVEYHWKPKTKESYSAGSLFSIKNLDESKDRIDVSLDSKLTKTLDLKQPPDFDVNASINKFSIVVADSLQLNFKKMAFKSGTSEKTGVDVKFETIPIRLIGSLSFVNSLQSVLKSDQFSAGPYIDITDNGVVAGYNFPLPNVEVGILAISNMMLGAKLMLPFNKDPLKLGFNFCAKENPFKLMVSCFGGGGFFLMETTMQGLTRLDAAFEFGAGISLNVGVASGSVEVMGGIYYTLIMEDDINKQSMTAYIRMTGRLSIIGLIKVTLEFYLEMVYEALGEKTTEEGLVIAGSSQLKGRATLSVKVEILFFSKTVKVTVSRTFAGNDADPKFQDTYTIDHWQNYCAAFAS